jgi:type I restriction enzyme R subunit
LINEIAGLPSGVSADDIEARMFDLIALRMQIALAEGGETALEKDRQRVVSIAMSLEEKPAIPAVRAQLEFIARLQQPEFWQGIQLADLEDMRLRLRGLMPLLDRKKRHIVYTDFKDEVLGVRSEEVIVLPSMTGAQYEKKVRDFLRSHQDDDVIRRLRLNEPLSAADLARLEQILVAIGAEDGKSLLAGLLSRSEAPTLAYFVRSLVGLDRSAAQATFAEYLSDRRLTSRQMRFIELIVEQLTARGVIEASALYEPPFSDVHVGGPDELFAGHETVIEGIFDKLRLVRATVLAQAA